MWTKMAMEYFLNITNQQLIWGCKKVKAAFLICFGPRKTNVAGVGMLNQKLSGRKCPKANASGHLCKVQYLDVGGAQDNNSLLYMSS